MTPHCTHCGTPLEEVTSEEGYRADGSPKMVTWWMCPKRPQGWLSGFRPNQHSRAVEDFNGGIVYDTGIGLRG